MIALLTGTLNLDLELISGLLGILVIITGAIIAIVKLYLKFNNAITESNNKTTIAFNEVKNSLVALTNEILELKGYKHDIEENAKAIRENKTEIKLIKQRCEFIHEEKE